MHSTADKTLFTFTQGLSAGSSPSREAWRRPPRLVAAAGAARSQPKIPFCHSSATPDRAPRRLTRRPHRQTGTLRLSRVRAGLRCRESGRASGRVSSRVLKQSADLQPRTTPETIPPDVDFRRVNLSAPSRRPTCRRRTGSASSAPSRGRCYRRFAVVRRPRPSPGRRRSSEIRATRTIQSRS